MCSQNHRAKQFCRYLGLLFILLSPALHADCDNADPSVIAKKFYTDHANFYKDEPDTVRAMVTTPFYNALVKEHNCQKGVDCTIESDPWTGEVNKINANSFYGKIVEPITFELIENHDNASVVKMSYLFALTETQKWPQFDTLTFEKSDGSSCWLLSDIVTKEGKSFLKNSNKDRSFFIKVIDQNGLPVPDAKITYGIGSDTLMFWIAPYPKPAVAITDAEGMAKVSIPENGLFVTGISKEGYDIGLSSLGYNSIDVKADSKKIARENYFRGDRDLMISQNLREVDVSARENPLVVVTGWKLTGALACIERVSAGISFSDHEGEKNWDIDNNTYYYKVGVTNGNLDLSQNANSDDYDFKIIINRSGYPWHNAFQALTASFSVKIVFRDGGLIPFKRDSLFNNIPDNGYESKVTLSYRGLGEISSHEPAKRFYMRVGKRYGVMQLDVTPSKAVGFEYDLNRDANSPSLNILPYISDDGRSHDYLRCPQIRQDIPPQCAVFCKLPCTE